MKLSKQNIPLIYDKRPGCALLVKPFPTPSKKSSTIRLVKLLVKPIKNNKAHNQFKINQLRAFYCCRGRSRTSTGQLATAQRLSGQPWSALPMVTSALCCVCPVIPTLETRGHVCQKFHHPTVLKNNYDANLYKQLFCCKKINDVF